jgi:hypothetical protein
MASKPVVEVVSTHGALQVSRVTGRDRWFVGIHHPAGTWSQEMNRQQLAEWLASWQSLVDADAATPEAPPDDAPLFKEADHA